MAISPQNGNDEDFCFIRPWDGRPWTSAAFR